MADKKTSLSPAKNIFKDQRVLLAIVIALIVVIISCINPNFIGINNIVAIFPADLRAGYSDNGNEHSADLRRY